MWRGRQSFLACRRDALAKQFGEVPCPHNEAGSLLD
jgi:hypothetical protein